MEENAEADGHEDAADDDAAHRDVALRAKELALGADAFREQVMDGAAHDAADDTRHREKPDDARHGEHADADVAHVLREDRADRCLREQDVLAADDHLVVAAEVVDDRDADDPGEERTRRDDDGVAQTREIADAEERRIIVEAEDELVLVGERLAPRDSCRRQELLPPAERVEHEIVYHRDRARKQHDVRFRTLVRLQDFCGRAAGRERIDAVHFLAEITAEDGREEHAEHAAEDNRDGHFEEREVLDAEDVERRQDEHRAAEHVRARARDGLDVHGLRECVLAMEDDRHAHSEHGDRRKSIDRLADLQREVADREGEQDREEQSPDDDVGVDFLIRLVRGHQRRMLLPLI